VLTEDVCCLQVTDVGGFVSTPFDCELFAALTALSVAGVLADVRGNASMLASTDEWTSLVEQAAAAPAAVAAGTYSTPVTVLTDSKAVLRALRTGPSSDLGRRR
jgi:hypothetical protein